MKQVIDRLFAEFSSPEAPGIAVSVIKDSEILVSKGYGAANLETGMACSPRTNFRLASVTKQFTAMAVMILAERGKLRLDDSLTNIFPDYPAHGETITLRHLLTHRSGLLDYEDLIPASTTVQLKDRDVLELLRQQNKTYFSPGSAFRYSNTGYVFVALLVEKISGRSFAEFLRENIFRPLDMVGTVAFEPGISSVGHRALGYTGDKQTDQSVTSATLGDGGIYSSVADLVHWDQSLYTEQLVSDEMLRQAFAASSASSDYPDSGYGFGWYVTRRRGVECLWHYGDTCGFSSYIDRYPSKKLSVILLANRRDAALASISRTLVEMFWNESKISPCRLPSKA
ncbi:MAG TPA: serine hydrolase domain-containing protein [Candidatus Saccharimonadales bacterium]|nr:serine hydrolase domain-containing protein [Candidatus Saccharimonadales bacterium]